MLQDMPTYASVASSSRDPSVVNVEVMLPNKAADYNLESYPGFVRNCFRMSAFAKECSIIGVARIFQRGRGAGGHTMSK